MDRAPTLAPPFAPPRRVPAGLEGTTEDSGASERTVTGERGLRAYRRPPGRRGRAGERLRPRARHPASCPGTARAPRRAPSPGGSPTRSPAPPSGAGPCAPPGRRAGRPAGAGCRAAGGSASGRRPGPSSTAGGGARSRVRGRSRPGQTAGGRDWRRCPDPDAQRPLLRAVALDLLRRDDGRGVDVRGQEEELDLRPHPHVEPRRLEVGDAPPEERAASRRCETRWACLWPEKVPVRRDREVLRLHRPQRRSDLKDGEASAGQGLGDVHRPASARDHDRPGAGATGLPGAGARPRPAGPALASPPATRGCAERASAGVHRQGQTASAATHGRGRFHELPDVCVRPPVLGKALRRGRSG